MTACTATIVDVAQELLGKSFREHAKRKPINKITIANIADNCGMTQPTFYHHFHDKYDLMTWLYVSGAKNIMGQIGKDGYQWRDTLLNGKGPRRITRILLRRLSQ